MRTKTIMSYFPWTLQASLSDCRTLAIAKIILPSMNWELFYWLCLCSDCAGAPLNSRNNNRDAILPKFNVHFVRAIMKLGLFSTPPLLVETNHFVQSKKCWLVEQRSVYCGRPADQTPVRHHSYQRHLTIVTHWWLTLGLGGWPLIYNSWSQSDVCPVMSVSIWDVMCHSLAHWANIEYLISLSSWNISKVEINQLEFVWERKTRTFNVLTERILFTLMHI